MKHRIKGRRASSNDRLIEFLRNDISPNSTLLDLGCGPKLYSDALQHQCQQILTVDAWEWCEPDIVANLETTPLPEITDQQWDYVLMIDFIEHLDKAQGVRLINEAKGLVNNKIYLLTPMDTIWTSNHEHVTDPDLWCYGNEFDIHKSLWTPADFPEWKPIVLPGLHNYFIGYYEA